MSWIFILTRTVLWSEFNSELTGLMWGDKRSLSAAQVSIDADCGVGSRLWDSDAKVFPPLLHRALNCDAFFFPMWSTCTLKIWMNQLSFLELCCLQFFCSILQLSSCFCVFFLYVKRGCFLPGKNRV